MVVTGIYYIYREITAIVSAMQKSMIGGGRIIVQDPAWLAEILAERSDCNNGNKMVNIL